MRAKKIQIAGFFRSAALAKSVKKKLKTLNQNSDFHVSPNYLELLTEVQAELRLIEYAPIPRIKNILAAPDFLKKPFVLIIPQKRTMPKGIGIFNMLPWPCSDREIMAAILYHAYRIHKPAEAPQMRHSEWALLKEAVDQSDDAVVIADRNGIIQYVNSGFQRITGYSKTEAIGQTPRLLKSGFHDKAFYERLWKTILAGKVFRDIEVNKKKNGDLIYVDHSITPIRDRNGEISHFLGTWKDISEKRSTDAALASANREIEIYHRRLEGILNSAHEAIISVSEDQRILVFNRGAERLFGYTASEVIGKPLNKLIPMRFAGQHGAHVKSFRDMDREGERGVKRGPLPCLRKDGTEFMAEITISKQHEGHTTLFSAFIRDVSERYRMIQELQASEEKYRIVADKTHDWEFWLTPEKTFIYTSPSCERITGYTADEFRADPDLLRSLVVPDDLPVYDGHVHSVITSPHTASMDFRIISRSGGLRWIQHVCQPIFDDAGKFLGTRGSNRDLTEHKRAENALKESEQSYIGLFNTVNEAIYIQNEDGVFIDVNEGAVKMYGYPREDFIGRTPEFLSAPGKNDLQVVAELIKKVFETGLPETFEFWGLRRKGEHFPKEVICNKGKYFGQDVLITTARDITEFKRTEEALRIRERHAKSLLKMSGRLELALNYDDIMLAALDEIREIIGYRTIWVYLLSEDRTEASGLSFHGEQRHLGMDKLHIKGDRMLEEIAEGAGPIVVSDALLDDRTDKKVIDVTQNRTIVNLPVYLLNNRLAAIGTGTFGDEGVRVPTPQELDYLETMASHIAVAMDRIFSSEQKKKIEHALAANEKRFRALIENAMEGIVLLRIDENKNGIISYVSPSVTRVMGYTQEEALKVNPDEATHPDDLPIILDALSTVLHNPAQIPTVSYRFRHKNGTWRWIESTVTNLLSEPSVASIVLNYRDITEKKKSEARLHQQLDFSNALNRISGTIIKGTGRKELLLTEMAAMVGQTLKVDRSLIFDVDITTRKVRSVCKWIHSGLSDFAPGEEVYSLNLFPKSVEKLFHHKRWIQSYSDNRSMALTAEGSDKLLHDQMGIKSLLWFPFSFDDTGFYLLAFNMMQDLRRWTEEEIQFLENVSKQVELAIMQSRMMYERKKAEQKLEETLQEFETLTEGIPDAIFFKDGFGRWLIINAAAKKLFQLDTIEWYGKTDAELAAMQPYLKPAYDMCMATDAEAWANGKRTASIEVMTDLRGRQLFYETTKIPLYDKNGNRLGLVIIGHDITFQRQAKELISEQTLILDAANDAIVMTDLQQNVIYWNKGAETIYGWAKNEAIGRKINELFCVKDMVWMDAHEAVMKDGSWTGEVPHKTKKGQAIVVENRISLVNDSEGHAKSLLFMNSDVTEKRRMEKQFLRTQRMESIGRMAGGIAHDLNNILTPILMAVQIFRDKVTDESLQRIIMMLESNVLRGADLMRKLLMFTKGAEGELRKINLIDAIREVEKIVRSTFPKNIAVVCDVAPQLWPIRGDMTQLHQVLLNLCVNARDAMPAGGQLILETENIVFHEDYIYKDASAKPGNYVALKIADTGTGISPEVLEHMFEPFYTTKDMEHGTGLGLSTVAAIVKGHNGFVNVYSEIGKGTQFKIYFPAEESGESEIHSDQAPAIYNGNGETILIVDDEPAIRKVLAAILEEHGYKTLEAEDGTKAAALYFANAAVIHAVITDMSMPFMDGPTLIRTLRNIRVPCKILAMSGLPESEREQQLKDLSVDGFIMKPFRSDKILFILHGLLHG